MLRFKYSTRLFTKHFTITIKNNALTHGGTDTSTSFLSKWKQPQSLFMEHLLCPEPCLCVRSSLQKPEEWLMTVFYRGGTWGRSHDLFKVTQALKGRAGIQTPCSAYFRGPGSACESINHLVSEDEGRWTLWVLLTWGSRGSPFWPYPHSTLWQLLVASWQCLLQGSR